MKTDVLIVGAGQGGAQAAMSLRQQKFPGSVTVIGAEPDLPYERPLLSKEYLAGERDFHKLLLRGTEYWAEKNVEIILGKRVIEVGDHVAKIEGTTIEWGKLIWATGGAPRRLSCAGHDLVGVHSVRDRGDVDRLKEEMESAQHVVVIGGGYIGLEAASVLSKKGKNVTVLEALDRVLARVAGEPLSRFFEEQHRAHGVDIHLNAKVECLEEKDGKVSGVRLASGDVLPADLVIVGIGILPAVEPLIAAGAKSELAGVLVDLHGKTSLPDVFATGDCAAHANVWANGHVARLESIQNANDLSMIIAKSIAGTLKENERYDAVPWFWSNQFDLRLQTMGLFTDYDDIVVRGEPSSKAFSVCYLRDQKLIAADCVNHTKDYMQSKPLIASGKSIDRARLADPAVLLKEL